MLSYRPCEGERVRVIIIASNCFAGWGDRRHIRNKYAETIIPFIETLGTGAEQVEHYLVRFCIKIDKAKRIDLKTVNDMIAEQPHWINWGAQKKAYQGAMIEANMLAAEKAKHDKEIFKVIFVSAMQVDYEVRHALNLAPYLEHTYAHRMFYMHPGYVKDGGKPIADETGLPLEFITQIDYRNRYVTPVDNVHICKGLTHGEECLKPLECRNNLACVEQKCGCPHPGMISTVDKQYCRLNTYQPCNHKWSCQEALICELKVCRGRMPSLICPERCESTNSCPEKMICSDKNICEYSADKVWFNWIYNKSITTNEQLLHKYNLQYYWLILSGVALLISLIGIPSIVWYRIKKNTIVPAEVVQRITQIPETIALRVSKIARTTRDTLSKAHFPKFSRFENWPSRDSEDE
ncbi:hypothetical protein GJ496_007468 [Pomphorhynchus laevis]|nr:hypothetical protein GJ496_007468 [Pomphorhynchus laevis]